MKRPGIVKAAALVAVLLSLAASCAPAAVPAPKQESQQTVAPKPAPTSIAKLQPLSPPVKVKVGMVGRTVGLGSLYIAEQRGYFKEQGIDVETVPIDSGPRVIPLLATGDVDVGAGALGAGLFNSLARGVDIKVVAGISVRQPGIRDSIIAVRKDLIDSGAIKDFADLKGRTVAIAARDGGGGPELEAFLAKGNLKFSDVNVIELPYSQMLVAFGNKSIDAGLEIEPFGTQGTEKGLSVPLKGLGAGDVNAGFVASVYFYSPKFIAKNEEAAKRFMVALIQGQRDFNRAFHKNQDREAIVSIMAEATKMEPASLNKMADSKTISWFSPDGHVDVKSVAKQQDWFAEQGFVPQKVDLTVVIDNRFADFAVQVLGKYQD